MEVPLVGLSMDAWITNQAKLVLKLCQRARINSGSSFRFAAYRQSKIMDWDETQAIEARPGFWWCSGGTNYISQCFLSHIYPENSNEHDWRYCYPLNCISVNYWQTISIRARNRTMIWQWKTGTSRRGWAREWDQECLPYIYHNLDIIYMILHVRCMYANNK